MSNVQNTENIEVKKKKIKEEIEYHVILTKIEK